MSLSEMSHSISSFHPKFFFSSWFVKKAHSSNNLAQVIKLSEKAQIMDTVSIAIFRRARMIRKPYNIEYTAASRHAWLSYGLKQAFDGSYKKLTSRVFLHWWFRIKGNYYKSNSFAKVQDHSFNFNLSSVVCSKALCSLWHTQHGSVP